MSFGHGSRPLKATEQKLLDDDKAGIPVKVTAIDMGMSTKQASNVRKRLSLRGLLTMKHRGPPSRGHKCKCSCGKSMEQGI